ncbi:class I SAM-dependent methyltransferase [Candidatus Woesearchaeota archaeon]|jgi:tRNA/tmRNA/rRNA uracil-C5-methylase (TrmA/RlmC/RlmD family)|nr:class I SAM-dependent methyltransferase [Candidatus Woesearchaeota archaeon]
MASIEDYFARNRIIAKGIYNVPPEFIRVTRIPDDEEYYEEYYRTGLDDFFECVNFHPNKRLFTLILSLVEDFQDLFEPCCQSGLFGSYIAGNHDGTYRGMDINQFAIEKAKQRAIDNELDPNIFQQGNIFEYEEEHEAIVGRYVINRKRDGVYPEMVEKVCNISRNIILVQTVYGNNSQEQIFESYKREFAKHNYSFEVLAKSIKTLTSDSYSFVFKASK